MTLDKNTFHFILTPQHQHLRGGVGQFQITQQFDYLKHRKSQYGVVFVTGICSSSCEAVC